MEHSICEHCNRSVEAHLKSSICPHHGEEKVPNKIRDALMPYFHAFLEVQRILRENNIKSFLLYGNFYYEEEIYKTAFERGIECGKEMTLFKLKTDFKCRHDDEVHCTCLPCAIERIENEVYFHKTQEVSTETILESVRDTARKERQDQITDIIHREVENATTEEQKQTIASILSKIRDL